MVDTNRLYIGTLLKITNRKIINYLDIKYSAESLND